MSEQNAEQSPPPKKKSKLPLTLGVIGGLVLLQGAGFFLFMKFSGGGPKAASAQTAEHGEAEGAHEGGEEAHPPAHEGHGEGHEAEGAGEAPEPGGPSGVEVLLLKSFKVPNRKSGKTYIYDLDISVVVAEKNKTRMEELARKQAAALADCIARIVRSAEPRVLNEDDFRTLRGQLKDGLDEVFGDDRLIQKILIPRAVPIRAE